MIALVLDRVPAGAAEEVSAHLPEMLAAHDLSAAPLFVLPETTLDGQGLLAEELTRPLHDWFAQLARIRARRARAVVRQTLDGALAALEPAVARARRRRRRPGPGRRARAGGTGRPRRTGHAEARQWSRVCRTAGCSAARSSPAGRSSSAPASFCAALESKVGPAARPGRRRGHRPADARPRLCRPRSSRSWSRCSAGSPTDAAEQAYAAWQAHPAGAALLEPALQKPVRRPGRTRRPRGPGLAAWVLDLVRSEAGDKRFVARGAAYAVNGLGLTVMIAVFTSTAFIPTGAELAVGAGTTVAAQKLLEAIFGDQAIRTLAGRAREELVSRIETLLETEAARYFDRTSAAGLEAEPGASLRRAADDVENAREELALTAAATPALPPGGAS